MTVQVEIPPDLEERLRNEAADRGQNEEAYLSQVVQRELLMRDLEALKRRTPPSSLGELRARTPTEAGKSWVEEVAGKWPGDESDEEIYRALEELS
jgi:hypothetical protein